MQAGVSDSACCSKRAFTVRASANGYTALSRGVTVTANAIETFVSHARRAAVLSFEGSLQWSVALIASTAAGRALTLARLRPPLRESSVSRTTSRRIRRIFRGHCPRQGSFALEWFEYTLSGNPDQY